MADDADMSAAQQERILEAAIAAARVRADPGRLECEDCDAVIPDARRVALPSARRCVACQSRMEGRR